MLHSEPPHCFLIVIQDKDEEKALETFNIVYSNTLFVFERVEEENSVVWKVHIFSEFSTSRPLMESDSLSKRTSKTLTDEENGYTD